jgi:hypothetical protein
VRPIKYVNKLEKQSECTLYLNTEPMTVHVLGIERKHELFCNSVVEEGKSLASLSDGSYNCERVLTIIWIRQNIVT